ncbi:MAG: substrate-binding domain-containing protein, partial [Anaerolineales bacterium]
MSKKLFTIVLLLITAVMLVSCGGAETPEATEAPGVEEPAEAPLLVAINKSADQQYFIDLQTAFTEKAEELGADARTFNAKLDPNLGVSLVEDAISAGAGGIAITVPDQTIGPAIAQAAEDAGVVMIATDDNIVDADGDPVPFVGFNGTDMGRKVG